MFKKGRERGRRMLLRKLRYLECIKYAFLTEVATVMGEGGGAGYYT